MPIIEITFLVLLSPFLLLSVFLSFALLLAIVSTLKETLFPPKEENE